MTEWGFEVLRSFEVQEDGYVLRRYMSHDKFASFVTERSLYFPPAATFRDHVEGYYTERDYQEWRGELKDGGLDEHSLDRASRAKDALAWSNRQAVVISCWTGGCEEDARVWNEYGDGPQAVAIECTVGGLRKALGPAFLIIPACIMSNMISTAGIELAARDLAPPAHQRAPAQRLEIRPAGTIRHDELRVEHSVGKCAHVLS
jgi:hypothetical protein